MDDGYSSRGKTRGEERKDVDKAVVKVDGNKRIEHFRLNPNFEGWGNGASLPQVRAGIRSMMIWFHPVSQSPLKHTQQRNRSWKIAGCTSH
jgi:hypothetical protein